MLWNCHRGIYRNDFYVNLNHPTYLSELVTNFGGLQVELGYPLQVRFLKIYPPFFWSFSSSHGFSTNLLSKIQGWSDLLLQFSPFCLGFLVLLGSLEVSFSWKLTTSCQCFFPKRCQYHCIILLWLLYDTSMILLGVVPLWIRWMTRTIHRFHTNFWCDSRDQHRILSSGFNTELPWKSIPELSSSPSMFSDLAWQTNICGLKEDIPSPWALPQALALDDWVMKQGSTT